MRKKITDFDQLISEARFYLCKHLRYRPTSSQNHKRNWKRIARFMIEEGISDYSIDIEKKILYNRFKDRPISSLNYTEKEFYNSVKMFSEFVLTGEISISPRMRRNTYVFRGVIGKVIAGYIIYKKCLRVSPQTLRTYNRYLLQLNDYCIDQKLTSIDQLDLNLVTNYIRYISRRKGYPVGAVLSVIRTFINPAASRNLFTAPSIPGDTYKDQ